MADKKHLDFNLGFMEDDKAKAGESGKEATTSTKLLLDKVTLIEYFKYLFRDFPSFSEAYLQVKRPPHLFFVIWLSGIAGVFDRLEYYEAEPSGWVEIWIIAAIGGILTGYLAYWIGGAIYHLRVKWSKGRDHAIASRNIYMYSGVPISVTMVIWMFLNMVTYGNDYFYSDGSTIDVLFVLIFIGAVAYSIRLSYKAVMHVQKTKRTPAIVWFVVLPAIFYGLVFFSSFLSALEV